MSIVVAVDRNRSSDRIVQEAKKLADAFGDELHVVHVLSRSEFMDIELDSVEQEGHGVNPDRIRERAREIAADSVGESDGRDVVSVGRIGKAGEEITKYADEIDAGYIVIGGRKRSPIGKALFGSVAQAVLLEASCTVVSVLERIPEWEE